MKMGGRLNLDIPHSIAEFESLIEKILPKRIMYKLISRGRGLEFDSYRDFAPDEDSDSIDWKASVRANKLLARQYIEERDIKVIFVIDVGENMISGSGEKLKCEYCAELTSALAHVIMNSGDQIGFVLYNDKIVKIRLPGPGKDSFDIFVDELSNSVNYGGNSDIAKVFDNLVEVLNPSISLVILISDFINIDEDSRKNFEQIGNLCESIAIIIRDPLDKTLPEINKEIVIENSNTKEKMIINPKIAKNIYEKNAEKQINLVKDIFQSSNIDFLEVVTDASFSLSLATFLKNRVEGR